MLLTAFSSGYGYHRDELYFRMLPADVGYVDQPPLTPFLARLTKALIADEPWALRIPATLCVALSVLVIAATARELGGGRLAATMAAWSHGFAAATLMIGHVLLTSTVDLLLWPLLVLVALRAIRSPRWWLAAGALGGFATWNRWLVVVLGAGLVLGLLACGPRRVFRQREVVGGLVLALLVAAPNLAYQALNGWPQLDMGEALAANNGGEVRAELPLMLVLLLGPPLLPIWVTGLVALIRRPGWRDQRWLAVAFGVLVAFTWAAGAQPHYLLGLLPVMLAAGCVPTAEWMRARRWRSVLVVAGVALNGVVAAVIALPLIPADRLAETPVPGIGPIVPDSLGWPAYVDQVAAVHDRAGGGATPIITSNYGEAGAIARFGPARGLPAPLSGQNQLWYVDRPPDGAETIVMVGAQLDRVVALFETCEVITRLDNGVGVENEEQGEPVAICSGPVAPWSQLWGEFRHLD
ncbi:hypothetical protein ASG90_04565 [Nocardioides sp. Soil797]|nr:hypothetical protein ASG90_04565 [Nocardioides sp. Soil797]